MLQQTQAPPPLPQWQADRICSAAAAADPSALEAALQQAADAGAATLSAVNCRDSERRLTPLHWTSLGNGSRSGGSGCSGNKDDSKEAADVKDSGAGKCAALLLSRGADPNAKDANGSSPLHYAARYNCLAVCQQLVTCRRLRVDLRNRWGRTALMFAAWGEAETVTGGGVGGSGSGAVVNGSANATTQPTLAGVTAAGGSDVTAAAVVAVASAGQAVGAGNQAAIGRGGGGTGQRNGSLGGGVGGGGTVGPGGATVGGTVAGHGATPGGGSSGRGGGGVGRGRGSISSGGGGAGGGAGGGGGIASAQSGAAAIIPGPQVSLGVALNNAGGRAGSSVASPSAACIDGSSVSGGVVGGGNNGSLGGGSGDRAEVARALLAAGASADVRDSRGRTALMWAALTGKAELLRLLLAAGADWRRRNHEGLTAGQLAAREGHGEAARLLQAVLEESLKAPPVVALSPFPDSARDGAAAPDGASPSLPGTG